MYTYIYIYTNSSAYSPQNAIITTRMQYICSAAEVPELTKHLPFLPLAPILGGMFYTAILYDDVQGFP